MLIRPEVALVGLTLTCISHSHALEAMQDCALCPEMVVLPAGEFTMGSSNTESTLPDEKPAHTVRIARAFAVGKFEVTFQEWDACAAEGDCKPADDEDWGRGRRPVINIDHAAAKTYAAWLSRRTGKSYRLLSEAEWEYAARAGTTGAWFWGSIEEGIGIPAGCL